MAEKPEGTSTPEKKKLPDPGQEARVGKVQETDKGEAPEQSSQAAQRLSEAAWGSEQLTASAYVPSLPKGFPQPELVGERIVEGQVVKPDEFGRSWDLNDQQIEDLAKQVRLCLDRRAFGGLGNLDPDTKQVARLLEGLKLSDRRAVEMVLSRKDDFRSDLQSLLANKPEEFKNLIAILDRPDRLDNLPLENTQAVHYAHQIIQSLQHFSPQGAEATANLLTPLNQAERQQIENELSTELQMPFRDWLHRRMPLGHHQIGYNNEAIARIEATLDHPDVGTDYKGGVKVLMGGLKDNWSANKENAILHIVSGMNGKDIRESGLFEELRSSTHLSKTAQQVLDVTLAGHDKWTANSQQAQELAEIALRAKNLEIFKDAMQSPAAREYFKSSEGSKKIDQAYSGPFDSRDRQIAHDYAELNDTKLLTDLQMYQFSLSPSREAITQRLMSATEDEKKLFQEGRSLADLRPKETDEEKAANRYYLEVYEALRRSSKYDSNQLKDWTGMLLDTGKKAKPEKPDARQQILEINKSGLSGIDAVRQLEDVLKNNPDLVEKLSNNGQDEELQSAFKATLKRVSEDARNSAIATNIWKDASDPNNLNPILSIMAAPERLHRQGELARKIEASAQEMLTKKLLSEGHLTLEQKLFVAGDKKLSADDLLALNPGEKQRLLKGQYPQKIQDAVFGQSKESQFIRSILSKQDPQLTNLDKVRAFSLGRSEGIGQIEALLGDLPAAQRKELSDQYFDKYKSIMHADILNQIKDPVDKARLIQSFRHTDDTAEQKLINTQIEQTKHSGPLDGLSEAYSPDQRMANKYSRAAESFYRQVKDGLSPKQKEILDNLPADKKQEIALALMKYQSALKKYWSAQKDYTHNKEEMAEQLADATLTAGAVIGSIIQPELSPALLARSAMLSAAGRLGIKQAILDKDFDTSQKSIEKELYKGAMTGALNSLGGELFSSGRFVSLSKFGNATKQAAEKTITDLSANQALKSVLKEDAAELLNSKLQQTTMDKVFGSSKRSLDDATSIAKSIAPKANASQLDDIAKAIQQHRRQEVLNSFKGKVWHEGDQLLTTVTSSFAGATFSEMASTAAGYESPSTLLKRLESSGQAAIAGGMMFHFGFKAAGKGLEGLTAVIGRDTDGRLFAGSGTRVLTAEGNQLTVGKEPYYFKPDDKVVECKRSSKPQVDAPPLLKAAMADELPNSISKAESSVLERLRPKPKDVKSKNDPFDAFDQIPNDQKRNMATLSDEQIDIFLNVYTHSPNQQDFQQMISFLHFVKLNRERADQFLKEQDSIQGPQPRKIEETASQPTELSNPRVINEKSPETIKQMAIHLRMNEAAIKTCYTMPTDELRYFAEKQRKIAREAPPEEKVTHSQLSTFLDMLEVERVEQYKRKNPDVDPLQVDILTRSDIQKLGLYRDFQEAIYNATTQSNLKAKFKTELDLIRDLEAEHLTKALNANLANRLSLSEKPSVGEELRLLWQYNLGRMRHGINALIGMPTPEAMTEATQKLTLAEVSKIEGVPKPTGKPIQVTESLVSIPWKDGEILYSLTNKNVTINDQASKTSRTLNKHGQLIESFNNKGELFQYSYDTQSNEIKKFSSRRGSDIISCEKDQGSYHATRTAPDGSQEFESLNTVNKVTTNQDGSYTMHYVDSHTTVFPDGSKEIHANGKRTQYHANLQTEQAKLKSNIVATYQEITDGRPRPRVHETVPEAQARQKQIATKREERFVKLLSEFESTAAATKMKPEDQANFYKQLNRLLEDNKDYAIKSKAGRRELAEQVLYNATHAREIDQGKNNTCNVTTVEKRCWSLYPSQMAQFAADVAETGKFITTSGEVIDLTKVAHGIRPDIEARRALKLQRQGTDVTIDGQRSWLSQMTQLAMVNTGWKKMAVVITPDHVLQAPHIAFDKSGNLLGQIDPKAVGKIYDKNEIPLNRWDGREEIYDDKKQPLKITKDDLVYDAEHHILGVYNHNDASPLYDSKQQIVKRVLAPGDVIYASPGGAEVARHLHYGDVQYGKLGNPIVSSKTKEKLNDYEMLFYNKGDAREYCRNEKNAPIRSPNIGLEQFMRISDEFTGHEELTPFVVIRASTKQDRATRRDISTKEELRDVIADWKTKNLLPGVIYVHAGKPPFDQHFDPKDAAAMRHGWHVINIWGIENDMVDITNQWGKKHNVKISLEQLFEAMTDPTGRTGV